MKHRVGLIIRGTYLIDQKDLHRIYETNNIHEAIQKELEEYMDVIKDEIADGFLFGIDDAQIQLFYEGQEDG